MTAYTGAQHPLKVLVVSFYYPPDLAAGSFRCASFVSHVLELAPRGTSIRLLTTVPNRYASHEMPAPLVEEQGGLRVERISVPGHRSGFLDQARTFLAFAREVKKRTAGREYDLVFATSSRLMTAYLASQVADRTKAPLYVDLRDIFVETIEDVLPAGIGRALRPFLGRVERTVVRRSDRVNLVSEGFRPYFEARYPGKHYDFYTNGIDEEFLSESWRSARARKPGPIRVVYAGNIGEGQGLHRILPGMAKALGEGYEFVVVGDGGRRPGLSAALEAAGVRSVSIRKPVPRAELIALYRDADVLFLHLNDYRAFARVLPSKIFEYAATGMPLLAGVAGHAAQFLKDKVPNCAVFHPCDVEAGVKSLRSLPLTWTDRRLFIESYRRSQIMRQMALAAIDLASARGHDAAATLDRARA